MRSHSPPSHDSVLQRSYRLCGPKDVVWCGGTKRDEAHAAGTVSRVHAWQDHVHHPLLDGAHWWTHLALWSGDHRLAIRCGEHAHHDSHGLSGGGEIGQPFDAICALLAQRGI